MKVGFFLPPIQLKRVGQNVFHFVPLSLVHSSASGIPAFSASVSEICL